MADAALYSQENIEALGETPWISRVPASIAEVQQLMQTLPQEMFTVSSLNNYSIAEVCSTYAGVRQRWLVVQSEPRPYFLPLGLCQVTSTSSCLGHDYGSMFASLQYRTATTARLLS